jgi:hypothetical protein
MKTRYTLSVAIFITVLTLVPSPSLAQLNGHNTKGDFGLQSGTQAPPGFYLIAPMYVNYSADTLKNRDGDRIVIDPDQPGSLDVDAFVLGLIWVSEFKIFGGNYSFQVYAPFANNSVEAPILGLQDSVSTAFGDLYLQPVNLGWHTDRADFIAGLGIYAPTGRYESGGDENIGLGMWGFEFFAGTTVYFDKNRSWHLAATAFFETHTEKKDTDITVGDLLTVEGGFGKSFMDGAINVGAAFYGQWKLSHDDFGVELPGGPLLGKHKVYGIGPEISVPIATKKKLIGFVSARYLWESGARSTLEGQTFVLTATFPIPSIPPQ